MKLSLSILIIVSAFFLCAPAFSSSAIDITEANRAAYWNNRLWFSERLPKKCKGSDCGSDREHRIYSYDITSEEAPKLEFQITLPAKSFGMLGDSERLWLFSDKTTGYFDGKKYNDIKVEKNLSEFSRPFIYKGLPTAIEKNGDSFIIKSLSGNYWKKTDSIKLNADYNEKSFLKAVVIGEDLHFFLSNDSVLYYNKGIPDKEHSDYMKWERIADYEGYWTCAVIENNPAVFYTSGSALWGRIEGFVLSKNGWDKIYKGPDELFGGDNVFGVFPISERGFLLFQHSFWRAKGIIIEDRKKTSTFRIGVVSMIGAMIFVELLMILMISCVIVLWVINPFFAYKYGLTQYSETREYSKDKVNIAGIMARDYTNTKAYLIKQRPEHNALTIRMKIKGGTGQKAIALSALYFNEEADKVKIRLVSKLPNIIWMMMVIMFLMTSLLFSRTNGASSETDMTIYVIYALLLIGLPLTLLISIKTRKKVFKEFFDLILVYLGIEEKYEIEKLL